MYPGLRPSQSNGHSCNNLAGALSLRAVGLLAQAAWWTGKQAQERKLSAIGTHARRLLALTGRCGGLRCAGSGSGVCTRQAGSRPNAPKWDGNPTRFGRPGTASPSRLPAGPGCSFCTAGRGASVELPLSAWQPQLHRWSREPRDDAGPARAGNWRVSAPVEWQARARRTLPEARPVSRVRALRWRMTISASATPPARRAQRHQRTGRGSPWRARFSASRPTGGCLRRMRGSGSRRRCAKRARTLVRGATRRGEASQAQGSAPVCRAAGAPAPPPPPPPSAARARDPRACVQRGTRTVSPRGPWLPRLALLRATPGSEPRRRSRRPHRLAV